MDEPGMAANQGAARSGGGRGRRRLRALGRIAGVLLLLLLAGEIGLRGFGPRLRFPTPCKWNPRVGCMLEPNLHEHFAVEEPFEFTTNGEGRRDRERGPKAPGARRILLLGDSVAFGVPVGDGETLAARLEERLAGDRIEVVNAGSPYLRGTEQQLSYFIDYGRALEPDLVLLEFTVQNDFFDNVHHYFWWRGPAGLERVAHSDPPTLKHRLVLASGSLPGVRWLDDHSWLFGAFRVAFWSITHLPQPPPTGAGEWAGATEEVIARLGEEARLAGAKLAIVVMPAPRTIEALRQKQKPESDEDALIAAIAGRHGIPIYDPTPLLVAAPGDAPLLRDGHFTRRGNEVVAGEIAARIGAWMPARASQAEAAP